MVKLLWLIALACVAWRLIMGRWPWQAKPAPAPSLSHKLFETAQARALLQVGPDANRQEIMEAHRRLIAHVHPDRGGTNEQVHEANAARDLLLAQLTISV